MALANHLKYSGGKNYLILLLENYRSNFLERRKCAGSMPEIHQSVKSCNHSRGERERETERQRERERQTDRETDKQTNRQTVRQTVSEKQRAWL